MSGRVLGRVSLRASLLACACLLGCARGDDETRIGSKAFTESVLLAEMARTLIGDAEHRAGLGGTRVLWQALLHGEVDVYPEYTGSVADEILGRPGLTGPALEAALARRGVGITRSLGFENSYALGMRASHAAQLQVSRLSQLAAYPELRFGLSHEFLERADGFQRVRRHYGLTQVGVRGLDHELAYQGLLHGEVDVTDLYSTDAEIARHRLQVLTDDAGVFPAYHAVLLYRRAWARRHPDALSALARLEGAIDADSMRSLNASVKFGRRREQDVSAQFVRERLQVNVSTHASTRAEELLRHTRDHLQLSLSSLLSAMLAAVPLGVLAARRRRTGKLVLALSGMLQTLPSLALLVFMIPLLGIGPAPAIAALFLYSLLPIVRGTFSGLSAIPPSLIESALVLGLSSRARLLRIELPLAAPAILSGIKTAAVINVGTATLGALIGAGGYGEPILSGIRRDDYSLILMGAVPAALLALAMQGGFDLLERWLVPAGLREPRAAQNPRVSAGLRERG